MVQKQWVTLCLRPAPMRLLNKGPICSIIIYWHKGCSQGGNIIQNRNSGLGSSRHRGFLLWTAISSSISENKRTQVFLPKSKIRKILTLSLEATSFMELPHHVSFTDPVKYTECDTGTQELNSLAGLFLRGKSRGAGKIHQTVNVLLQKPFLSSSIITANITLAWYRKQGVSVGANSCTWAWYGMLKILLNEVLQNCQLLQTCNENSAFKSSGIRW